MRKVLYVLFIALAPYWVNVPAALADEGHRAGEDVYATEVGDDNADGVIDEDESGWDCATMGNLSCGPFDQRTFPCEEDEVLGYAPQFGPNRVGCLHIEEV